MYYHICSGGNVLNLPAITCSRGKEMLEDTKSKKDRQ